jgi:butyrate kinase
MVKIHFTLCVALFLTACQSFDPSWLSGLTEVAKVAADANTERKDRKAAKAASSAASSATSSSSSYAPLSCAVASTGTVGGRTVACLKNNCGRAIEANFTTGSSGLGAGSCMQSSGTGAMAGCERGDTFDWTQSKCRR